MSASPHRDDSADAFIHREILQLSLLMAAAVAAFFLTRAVAANNADMSLRDAAQWYQRGTRAAAEGRIDDAIDAFRRATVRNRGDRQYVLALAHALARKGDEDGARAALVVLRDSTPEDPEINLELARLAAARQDATEALRFYHNALYAPWPLEQAEARRSVRIELIRFLLAHDQAARALSELLALSSDLPDDLAHHLEAARLFADAGDARHALEQYERALRVDADNAAALAGAGTAAFQLGQYDLAHRYLHRTEDENGALKQTRDVADLVLTHDPLAARLGSSERRRRLVANLAYARQRLADCAPPPAGGAPLGDARAFDEAIRSLEGQLKSPALEQDTIEAGVDLVDRIERQVAQRCGPPAALDQALTLIARRHGANPQ